MAKQTRREFVASAAALGGGVTAGRLGLDAGGGGSLQVPTAPSKAARLRSLLEAPGITLVPEAYSVFTARLAELRGYDAIYAGGNMMAGMYLGVEDWGLIDLAELAEIGGRIARGVEIPAIVDADQGGETALNVHRTVTVYERAGIAGLHIEDTRNPKHRGPGRSEMMPLDEMLVRVEAAVDARRDPDFVIIARTDCFILGSERGEVGEVVRRGSAFADAGADAFFVVGLDASLVDDVARDVPVPLVGLNLPLPEVEGTSLSVDIHGVQVYQAAAKLYDTMIGELAEHGRFLQSAERRLPPDVVAEVMDRASYDELADRWTQLGEGG